MKCECCVFVGVDCGRKLLCGFIDSISTHKNRIIATIKIDGKKISDEICERENGH